MDQADVVIGVGVATLGSLTAIAVGEALDNDKITNRAAAVLGLSFLIGAAIALWELRKELKEINN